DGRLGPLISQLAHRIGAAVYEPFSIRNLMAADDPVFQGYRPPPPEHDVLIVIDSQTPWIEATSAPAPDARVIHLAPDPHFARLPVRGFRCDLAVSTDPVLAVRALLEQLDTHPMAEPRVAALRTAHSVSQTTQVAPATGTPMSAEWLSACVGDIMDEDTIAFSELGLLPEYLNLKGQNRHFNNAHSGGLGWALPAALGAQLARPGKLTIACVGDGSYMFANPVACHQVAEALNLPILTIIKNNGIWNAVRRSVVNSYPDGAAARMNTMPLTDLSPQPDFAAIARASRGHAERVEDATALPDALKRAVNMIRTEARPVLLDCRVAVSDSH
ncbi:MAG: thiamine pyrophosphate-dependent enzyme, partial [Sulfitobacter sp.]